MVVFDDNCVSHYCHQYNDWSRWPRDLTRGATAARWLGLRVRIPPGTWMSMSWECYVLSSKGLCDGLITCPEESCRMWCV
jgi:hypothetical protein